MLINFGFDIPNQKLITAKMAIENNRPTDFWIQCVRDASGKWLKYEGHSSRYGVKYFRGHQPMVDYENTDEVTYLQKSLETRVKFYKGLAKVSNMDLADFTAWLEELRSTLEYRIVDEWLHQRFATTAHTMIVNEEVLAVAKKYGDPYATGGSMGPSFLGFPNQALPYDVVKDEVVEHHYPTLDWSKYYLASALSELKELATAKQSKQQYVSGVASFYQLLINLHYFAAMNASLYMNMANGLLEVGGINGIENGIIDFVALRLQPSNFQKFFKDEVLDEKWLR